jgi:hypothetical protein
MFTNKTMQNFSIEDVIHRIMNFVKYSIDCLWIQYSCPKINHFCLWIQYSCPKINHLICKILTIKKLYVEQGHLRRLSPKFWQHFA